MISNKLLGFVIFYSGAKKVRGNAFICPIFSPFTKSIKMNNYRETLLGKKCGIFPIGDRQIATLYCKRDLDCKALMINRNSDEFEFMVMCDIVHLPRDKGQVYLVVQPNEDIPTVYEMNLFINDFLKKVNIQKPIRFGAYFIDAEVTFLME